MHIIIYVPLSDFHVLFLVIILNYLKLFLVVYLSFVIIDILRLNYINVS